MVIDSYVLMPEDGRNITETRSIRCEIECNEIVVSDGNL